MLITSNFRFNLYTMYLPIYAIVLVAMRVLGMNIKQEATKTCCNNGGQRKEEKKKKNLPDGESNPGRGGESAES